jgi:hypothetical protein
MPRSGSDRALSTETRATKMAGDEIRKVVDAFKGEPRFMDQPRSIATQRLHDLIAQSPIAKQLINQGYTQEFAARAAKVERDAPRDPLGELVR